MKAVQWLLQEGYVRGNIDHLLACEAVEQGEIPEAMRNTSRTLDAANLFYAGKRADGYDFFGLRDGSEIHVLAGCRDFTIAEARDHWSAEPYRLGTNSYQRARWTWEAIDRIEAHFTTKVAAPAPEPLQRQVRLGDTVVGEQYSHALVEEFMGPALIQLFADWLRYKKNIG